MSVYSGAVCIVVSKIDKSRRVRPSGPTRRTSFDGTTIRIKQAKRTLRPGDSSRSFRGEHTELIRRLVSSFARLLKSFLKWHLCVFVETAGSDDPKSSIRF